MNPVRYLTITMNDVLISSFHSTAQCPLQEAACSPVHGLMEEEGIGFHPLASARYNPKEVTIDKGVA